MNMMPTMADWEYLKRKLHENPEDWSVRDKENIRRMCDMMDSMMKESDLALELMVGYWTAQA